MTSHTGRGNHGPSWRRFAPAAPARIHLMLAASMWTAVGCGLLAFGIATALDLPGTAMHVVGVGALGVGLGAAKGRWILARTARRIAARIIDRGDGRCLGGFLSPASWGMVVVMILAGRMVRTSHWLSRGIVAVLYAAVGTGLLVASIGLWRAWRTMRRDPCGGVAPPPAGSPTHPSPPTL